MKIKSLAFDCPRCGHVTARAAIATLQSDEGPIGERIDSITDFGSCPVAASARDPKRPLNSELADCPVFNHFPPGV